MKLIFKKLHFFLIPVIFFSCNQNLLNDFIEKNEKNTFLEFKGKSIYFRSIDVNNNFIYFFNEYEGSCSPIIVIVDKNTLKTIDIDLKLRSNCNEEVDSTLISDLVEKVITLEVSLIQVDSLNNVFINIDRSDLPNIVKKSSDSLDIKKLRGFKHYKNNWYIKDK